jgi:hypothetical protein
MNAHGQYAEGFRLRRVLLLAGYAFGEAVRRRIFSVLVILAGSVVGGGWVLREIDFAGAGLRFVADCGHGAMSLFGAVLTILTTAQLLCGELEQRTALPVLARPVRRDEFMVGKFLGAAAVASAFCAAVTCGVLVAMWIRVAGCSAGLPKGLVFGVLIGGVLQAGKLALLSAMVLLVGSYARSGLFTQSAGFLIFAICHLQYLAREVWRTSDGWAARLAGGAVGLVFPNFQLFGSEYWDIGDAGDFLFAGRVILYGLVYTAVFLWLAAWSFRRREL